jgi:ribose 5-phosphate isomerase B
MKLAVGSDEVSELTDALLSFLQAEGHELTLFGPLAGEKASWPEVARDVAEAVTEEAAEQGILCCWTGTGVSIAANKVPGVRAALCGDAATARGARLWNDANILCLSLRSTPIPIANEILQAWFDTRYVSNPEDDACLKVVRELDDKYRQTN